MLPQSNASAATGLDLLHRSSCPDSRRRSTTLSDVDLIIDPSGERTAAVYRALRAAIVDGRVPAGHRLPATRVLAAGLGISRGSVAGDVRRSGRSSGAAGRNRPLPGLLPVGADRRRRRRGRGRGHQRHPARPGPDLPGAVAAR
ncbi:GntR family transcriptional regulator [Actinoplanes derwentensis]|uniref:GntR family transcriptional regulator n=1 Tax=Actinoplanes derwentensis TaxID=113562 RepID=UPI0035A21DD5